MRAQAQQITLPVPVIVVGNISVGGSGKTPTLIRLIQYLKIQNLRVGVLTGGYGRKSSLIHRVTKHSSVSEAGDEALLIYRETQVPVFVGRDRSEAAKSLLGEVPECNVLISDDGLQHYRLARDVEIALVDGTRLWGNGHLLPVGPLREKLSRLLDVDAVFLNNRSQNDTPNAKLKILEALPDLNEKKVFECRMAPKCLVNIETQTKYSFEEIQQSHRDFESLSAIGNPEGFYAALRGLGFNIQVESFPDHYQWKIEELKKYSGKHLIITSKDAVKILELLSLSNLDAKHWYYLESEMQIPEIAFNQLITQIHCLIQSKKATVTIGQE